MNFWEETEDILGLSEIIPGLIDPITKEITLSYRKNNFFNEDSNLTKARKYFDKDKKSLKDGGENNTIRPTEMSQILRYFGLDQYSRVKKSKIQPDTLTHEKVRLKKQEEGFISSKSFRTKNLETPSENLNCYLLTDFKPAIGCTNASDAIIQCFVARLRTGFIVTKHRRSNTRWQNEPKQRILHIHTDGRSLTWKEIPGEPATKSRPTILDLSTCTEVRHAWSIDPNFPKYNGTLTLRRKCRPSQAYRSFSLIFPNRTVDITCISADQCKVLIEGFSALCFRIHVASLTNELKNLLDDVTSFTSNEEKQVKENDSESKNCFTDIKIVFPEIKSYPSYSSDFSPQTFDSM